MVRKPVPPLRLRLAGRLILCAACRHFNNRTGSPQHGPPCDMELGAVAMPSVMETLKKIGPYILSHPATRG